MQFYILMIDYGQDTSKVHGLEAVVKPELTRRQIVEWAKEVLEEDRNGVAFVKFVDGNFIEDITADIIWEAQALMLEAAE